MNKKAKHKEAKKNLIEMLPDHIFKFHFQKAVETLLPDIGEDNLIPQLILVHLDEENSTKQKPVYSSDFYILALDDFNEKRFEHIEQIGFKAACEKRCALMVCLASECWYSEQKGEKPDDLKYKRAGEDPNRKEAIMIAAKTIDGRSASAITIVERDAEERFVKFDNLRMAYSIDSDDIMEMGILDNFWSGYLDGIRRTMDIK